MNANDISESDLSCLGYKLTIMNQNRLTLLDGRMLSMTENFELFIFSIGFCEDDCETFGALIYIPVRNITEVGARMIGKLTVTPVCDNFYRFIKALVSK